jgi:hypothetical protein
MNTLIKKVFIFLVILLFFPTFSRAENSQWVEWIVDVEAAYAQINNLNYSAFSNDTNDDSSLALKTALGRYYQFSGTTRMHIAVELATERFDSFSSMDSNEVGANVGLRHKFGIGHNIPYVQLNASYRHQEVKSDPWSNDVFELTFEIGKHFTDNLSFAAGASYSSMNGKQWEVIVPDLSSQVFDQDFWHAFIFADYILSQDWLVSVGYGRKDGDFNSACTVENVGEVLESMQVKAITLDAIFGGCVYQIDGSTNIYSGNISYALSNHSAFNLSVEFYQGNANELDYHGSNVQISYNYRY